MTDEQIDALIHKGNIAASGSYQNWLRSFTRGVIQEISQDGEPAAWKVVTVAPHGKSPFTLFYEDENLARLAHKQFQGSILYAVYHMEVRQPGTLAAHAPANPNAPA